jgi:hypothetical protein
MGKLSTKAIKKSVAAQMAKLGDTPARSPAAYGTSEA